MPVKGSRKAAPSIPSTLKRSESHAQDVYEKTLAQAEKTYGGDEARAHRVAWSAVKHEYVKTDDHWSSRENTRKHTT